MKAFKLFRVMKDKELASLFINKKVRLPVGEWLKAEEHPTKGFAFRPYWHCSIKPEAPHLSEKGRAWYEIEMDDYQEFKRPASQGGMWFLADKIKILRPAQPVGAQISLAA